MRETGKTMWMTTEDGSDAVEVQTTTTSGNKLNAVRDQGHLSWVDDLRHEHFWMNYTKFPYRSSDVVGLSSSSTGPGQRRTTGTSGGEASSSSPDTGMPAGFGLSMNQGKVVASSKSKNEIPMFCTKGAKPKSKKIKPALQIPSVLASGAESSALPSTGGGSSRGEGGGSSSSTAQLASGVMPAAYTSGFDGFLSPTPQAGAHQFFISAKAAAREITSLNDHRKRLLASWTKRFLPDINSTGPTSSQEDSMRQTLEEQVEHLQTLMWLLNKAKTGTRKKQQSLAAIGGSNCRMNPGLTASARQKMKDAKKMQVISEGGSSCTSAPTTSADASASTPAATALPPISESTTTSGAVSVSSDISTHQVVPRAGIPAMGPVTLPGALGSSCSGGTELKLKHDTTVRLAYPALLDQQNAKFLDHSGTGSRRKSSKEREAFTTGGDDVVMTPVPGTTKAASGVCDDEGAFGYTVDEDGTEGTTIKPPEAEEGNCTDPPAVAPAVLPVAEGDTAAARELKKEADKEKARLESTAKEKTPTTTAASSTSKHVAATSRQLSHLLSHYQLWYKFLEKRQRELEHVLHAEDDEDLEAVEVVDALGSSSKQLKGPKEHVIASVEKADSTRRFVELLHTVQGDSHMTDLVSPDVQDQTPITTKLFYQYGLERVIPIKDPATVENIIEEAAGTSTRTIGSRFLSRASQDDAHAARFAHLEADARVKLGEFFVPKDAWDFVSNRRFELLAARMLLSGRKYVQPPKPRHSKSPDTSAPQSGQGLSQTAQMRLHELRSKDGLGPTPGRSSGDNYIPLAAPFTFAEPRPHIIPQVGLFRTMLNSTKHPPIEVIPEVEIIDPPAPKPSPRTGDGDGTAGGKAVVEEVTFPTVVEEIRGTQPPTPLLLLGNTSLPVPCPEVLGFEDELGGLSTANTPGGSCSPVLSEVNPDDADDEASEASSISSLGALGSASRGTRGSADSVPVRVFNANRKSKVLSYLTRAANELSKQVENAESSKTEDVDMHDDEGLASSEGEDDHAALEKSEGDKEDATVNEEILVQMLEADDAKKAAPAVQEAASAEGTGDDAGKANETDSKMKLKQKEDTTPADAVLSELPLQEQPTQGAQDDRPEQKLVLPVTTTTIEDDEDLYGSPKNEDEDLYSAMVKNFNELVPDDDHLEQQELKFTVYRRRFGYEKLPRVRGILQRLKFRLRNLDIRRRAIEIAMTRILENESVMSGAWLDHLTASSSSLPTPKEMMKVLLPPAAEMLFQRTTPLIVPADERVEVDWDFVFSQFYSIDSTRDRRGRGGSLDGGEPAPAASADVVSSTAGKMKKKMDDKIQQLITSPSPSTNYSPTTHGHALAPDLDPVGVGSTNPNDHSASYFAAKDPVSWAAMQVDRIAGWLMKVLRMNKIWDRQKSKMDIVRVADAVVLKSARSVYEEAEKLAAAERRRTETTTLSPADVELRACSHESSSGGGSSSTLTLFGRAPPGANNLTTSAKSIAKQAKKFFKKRFDEVSAFSNACAKIAPGMFSASADDHTGPSPTTGGFTRRGEDQASDASAMQALFQHSKRPSSSARGSRSNSKKSSHGQVMKDHSVFFDPLSHVLNVTEEACGRAGASSGSATGSSNIVPADNITSVSSSGSTNTASSSSAGGSGSSRRTPSPSPFLVPTMEVVGPPASSSSRGANAKRNQQLVLDFLMNSCREPPPGRGVRSYVAYFALPTQRETNQRGSWREIDLTKAIQNHIDDFAEQIRSTTTKRSSFSDSASLYVQPLIEPSFSSREEFFHLFGGLPEKRRRQSSYPQSVRLSRDDNQQVVPVVEDISVRESADWHSMWAPPRQENKTQHDDEQEDTTRTSSKAPPASSKKMKNMSSFLGEDPEAFYEKRPPLPTSAVEDPQDDIFRSFQLEQLQHLHLPQYNEEQFRKYMHEEQVLADVDAWTPPPHKHGLHYRIGRLLSLLSAQDIFPNLDVAEQADPVRQQLMRATREYLRPEELFAIVQWSSDFVVLIPRHCLKRGVAERDGTAQREYRADFELSHKEIELRAAAIYQHRRPFYQNRRRTF
ncbi:unnamed protein product [Amoebophrya sp. A25]|nr:unnamed protein product [Amoebophrya sp. A25]|eukprot:GSA25T00002515001.1